MNARITLRKRVDGDLHYKETSPHPHINQGEGGNLKGFRSDLHGRKFLLELRPFLDISTI